MKVPREARAKASTAGAAEPGPAAGATAGALLVAAREARGLSVDAVAQQLKLAPRQVRALEDGDYSLLPGRTFVRGFARNYARLVGLDQEHILGALPEGAVTPALEAPALHPTAPTMGELPTTERTKAPSWTRWAIPVSLAAVVATAAVYEWARPSAASRVHPAARESGGATDVSTTPPVAEKIETPLPNPVSGPTPATNDAMPASPAGAQGAAPASPEPAPTKRPTNAS